MSVHFQRATPIVGACRPRLIQRLVIASIAMIVTVQGTVAHASPDASRSPACARAAASLTTASSGLLMPSESDHPFTPFIWTGAARPALTTTRLLDLTAHAPGTPVEVVDLGFFFRNVAVRQPWHDRQQAMDVRRFQRLMRVIEQHLADVRVYREGTNRIDAYIVGRCGNDLTGLSTTLIET